MADHPYLSSSVSHPDGLPDDSRSSAPPPTSAYSQDLPYSGVPSFTYPAACEANLLTPISAAGSPPLHHRTKLMHQYSSSSIAQQPTPPATSKMYWTGSYDMKPSSTRSDSPMTVNPQAVSGGGHGSLGTTTADMGMDEIPPPRSPYLGHFGVSEVKPDPEEFTFHGERGYHSYYPDCLVDPMMLGQEHPHPHPHLLNIHQPMPQPSHRPVAHSVTPSTPILSNPSPDAFRGSRRPPGAELPLPDIGAAYVGPTGSPKGRKDKPFRVSKKASKGRSRSATQSRGSGRTTATPTPPISGPRGPVPYVPIQFTPDIPEKERFLFELREKHKDTKGKSMWADIGKEYANRFGKVEEKEALQMRISRGKIKYVSWSDEDLKLLRLAFSQAQKEWYRFIKVKFEEMGGGQSVGDLGLSPGDIEAKLVEMGLEDYYLDMDTYIRRRKRVTGAPGRRSAGKGEPGMPNDCQAGDEVASTTPYNPDEVLDQIDSRTGSFGGSTAGGGDSSLVFHGEPMRWSADIENQTTGSERVARQACEELMRVHISRAERY